jgi:hypothetical protein
MGSINLDFDFFDHPKVKRLIARLGRGAEVLPVRLWCYCGRYHCEDGRLIGYSDAEIEHLIGWWGEPGECIKGLAGLFIEPMENGNGWQLHQWLDYQGHIAAYKSRAKTMRDANLAKVAGKPLGKPLPKPLAKPLGKDLPEASNALHGIALHSVSCQGVSPDMDMGIPMLDSKPGEMSDYQRVLAACPFLVAATMRRAEITAIESLIGMCNGVDGAIEELNAAASADMPAIYAVKVVKNRMAEVAAKAQVKQENFVRTPNHVVRSPI